MTLTTRMVRLDKICGASGIPDNKKCRKGPLGAALGRQRDAQRTLERRYGKPKPLTKQQRRQVLGVTALAVGAGVGLGIAVANRRNRITLADRLALTNFRNRRAHVEAQGQSYRGVQQYVRMVERQQREVMREHDDFMRGYRIAPQVQPSPSSTSKYAPVAGSTEAKIHAAWTAKSSHKTVISHKNPNPDVSAAWAAVKQPKNIKSYPKDPDLSGVWAAGFKP